MVIFLLNVEQLYHGNFKKWTCIYNSTMESKFIALDKAEEEVECLQYFFKIFHCGQTL